MAGAEFEWRGRDMFLRFLLPFTIVLAVPFAAQAGDAAARKVAGFSPDGAYFAFEQYTMVYEEDAAFAEYFVVDTRSDKFVPGTPVRVLVRGDDGLDEKKAREDAGKKVRPILAKLRIGESGTQIEGKPSMDLDDGGLYHMDTQPLAKSLAFALPDGRKATLALTDKPMGKAMCDGYGGRAMKGRADVAGMKLTLTLDSKTTVLQDDKSLPASRRCAGEYGIAEAWLHTAPDGTVTLAALVEYADNHDYHAGPNRRFMAVTKRLPKS